MKNDHDRTRYTFNRPLTEEFCNISAKKLRKLKGVSKVELAYSGTALDITFDASDESLLSKIPIILDNTMKDLTKKHSKEGATYRWDEKVGNDDGSLVAMYCVTKVSESHTMESFINWCNRVKISPANESRIPANPEFSDILYEDKFFGKRCIIELCPEMYEEEIPKDVIPKMKAVAKFATTNKKMYDILYTKSKKWLDDVSINGKKCMSGKDLIKAIQDELDKRTLEISYDSYCNTIFVRGEYWIDVEHGFSISFPNGKFDPKVSELGGYDRSL